SGRVMVWDESLQPVPRDYLRRAAGQRSAFPDCILLVGAADREWRLDTRGFELLLYVAGAADRDADVLYLGHSRRKTRSVAGSGRSGRRRDRIAQRACQYQGRSRGRSGQMPGVESDVTFLPVIERELHRRARRRSMYWTRFAVALGGMLVTIPPFISSD